MIVDELVPRQYQEEIFVQAQFGNVIAALGTGSGKTYISTLLIKWIATQDVAQSKVIIFLVPKVPLVEQQGEFIAKQTTLRIAKLHGASANDLKDRAGWEKTFAENDVFVMTAQIFLNLITHSLWSIDKVCLLVFDECHHTRKNHPYNGIMREYMLLPEEKRPKVFGLTASPIQNSKNPMQSLNELETNMHARVICVLDHVAELAKHTPKPVEIIKYYSLPPEQSGWPGPLLYDCLNVFNPSTLSVVSSIWPDLERRYYSTLENLGPYCASLYLFTEMRRFILSLHLETSSRTPKDCDLAAFIHDKEDEEDAIPPDLLEMVDILINYECFFMNGMDSDASLPITIPISWFTPKVRTLVDVLVEHYTPEFQGIIFVEQRQVAACLAKVLPHIAELEGLVRCGEIVGSNCGDGKDMVKMKDAQDTLLRFREAEINLLIATSVAEEGLDFPACDLVVRFDALQHMVGYVQSRGRARNMISKFVVMLPEGDDAALARYHSFVSVESELKNIYNQSLRGSSDKLEDTQNDEDDDDTLSPTDLAARERFEVPSTGAFASYDNSINLIEHLCALIPHDSYTPPHAYMPQYSGDFQATLELPKTLPLEVEDLSYEGPIKGNKREAKRAAAFRAVKRLYDLGVLDKYLLPISDEVEDDARGDSRKSRGMAMGKEIPVMMDVLTCDPWIIRGEPEEKLWIHPVHGPEPECVLLGGLVTGTKLPSTSVIVQDISCSRMAVGDGVPLKLGEEQEEHMALMEEYTKLSISIHVSTLELDGPPSVYLVPLKWSPTSSDHLQPDYELIRRLTSFPKGHLDWSSVPSDAAGLLLGSTNQMGRVLILRKIRDDLTPLSPPIPDTREAKGGSLTYRDFYTDRWTRTSAKRVWKPFVPTRGPMLEVERKFLTTRGVYPLSLASLEAHKEKAKTKKKKTTTARVIEKQIMPQGCCSWFDISPAIAIAYSAFPVLCQHLTDLYVARQARFSLSLPPIEDQLFIQALTVPKANALFNNQRLETLGDAVLELCTTVHLFNKYPRKHEGQLSLLRQRSISNKFLCARAVEIGLERFILGYSHTQERMWRYVSVGEDCNATEDAGNGYQDVERSMNRFARQNLPRRSLQDCMEAILGASFLTGGIPMALQSGVSLGMTFGGPVDWPSRYISYEHPVSHLYWDLQQRLGYQFRNGALLKEAVTHPSFSSQADTGTYQRLEFLGDAILDLVVIHYLYKKFPASTSHQLAMPRTKAICSPALAFLAVVELNLHHLILANNTDLSITIGKYADFFLGKLTPAIIVREGWRYNPPKGIV